MRDRVLPASRPVTRYPGRWLAGFVLLTVCLVVPWLIPWTGSPQQTAPTSGVGGAAAGPARAPSSSASRGQVPDEGAVQRLQKTIQTEAVGNDVPVSAEDLNAVRTTPGPYRRVGRITIDEVGLDVAFGEGVFAQTLDRGPGHWPGTPPPGQRGNAVLSGHRNTQTAPFRRLDELKPGDRIQTVVGDSRPTTFAVVKTTIVPEKEYKAFVLRQPGDPESREVTLFACHPEGNPVFRIVVQARVA